MNRYSVKSESRTTNKQKKKPFPCRISHSNAITYRMLFASDVNIHRI